MGLATLSLSIQQRAIAALQRLAPASKLPPHLITGLRGEQAALFHLRRLGFTIVAQRWTSAYLRGDLDLVGWDGSTLVIFEVKTRTIRDFAPAETAVDRHKQRHLRRMAEAFLGQIPRTHRDRVLLRFDLVSVYLLSSGVEFEHFPNAFPRTAPPGRPWR
jgi:putative endonuclease